jgi:hypothetical protein
MRWGRPLGAAVVAVALEAVVLTDDSALWVPAVAAWIVAVAAIGFTGRVVPGLVLAAALAVLPIIGAVLLEPSPPRAEGTCDPSCGISTGGQLALLAPVVVALVVAGMLLGWMLEALARRRRGHDAIDAA